jgi:hypothetical protein
MESARAAGRARETAGSVEFAPAGARFILPVPEGRAMLAVGFIPRLDGKRKIRRVSDGSCDGHVTEWIGRRRPQGRPDSTVADATGI